MVSVKAVVLIFPVSVSCDQVNQVVPAHQVDDIDEAHQVDPVHQVDHKDEPTCSMHQVDHKDEFTCSMMTIL